MDRFDKIYHLHGLRSNRHTPVSLEKIKEHLECSKSTATRTIEILRDHLNAPLEYYREPNGYQYNHQSSSTPYELPCLWFSSEELHSLLTCQQIQQRINKMHSKENSPQPVIVNKIHFPSVGRRLNDGQHFKRIATALFSNKQLCIQYQARGQNSASSKRTISAQKLIYYRDNWYLAAHCHFRNELRIFSIDCVHLVESLEQTALIVDIEKSQSFLHSAYGIFTGKAEFLAVLEFTKTRANWVADEHWHPEQKSKWLKNGHYQQSIPFSDSRELIMDILKHGAEVKVTSPSFLQQLVREKMKNNYHNLTK